MLAAILIWGLLTLWIQARWPLSLFQFALFAIAGYGIHSSWRRHPRIPAAAAMLAIVVVWCILQILAGWTIDETRTLEAALAWTANLAALGLAFRLPAEQRERFLHWILWFSAGLCAISIFTLLTSRPGYAFWLFEAGTTDPTLGPFVYRNQYAAFVEAVLPLAILRAILDRQRWILYTAISALMFGSVVAGGSRAGTILCLAEILLIPMLVFARKLISGIVLTRALAGCVLAAAFLTAVVGWESIWNRLQEPNPYSLRRELVLSSVEMIEQRPWTGFGLGAWSSAYPAFAHFDDGKFVNQAHNDWIQWAAEGGLPFAGLMLAIVIVSVRPALRSMWGAGILVVFVHCLVDYPMQQRPALAAFFFAMLGSALAYDNRPVETKKPV